MQRIVFHGKGREFTYNNVTNAVSLINAYERFSLATKNHFGVMNAFSLHTTISDFKADRVT